MTPDIALQTAQQASISLTAAPIVLRNQAIQAIGQALRAHQNDILEANTLDLEASREMAVSPLLLDWLRLTPERLEGLIRMLQMISYASDPLASEGLATLGKTQRYRIKVPLGVVALVYESLPHLAVLATGMCLKTGNSLILRGGTEASHTNWALAQVLQSAIASTGLPENSVILLQGNEGGSIRDLVTQDRRVQLVIPYGRPSWVAQVVQQATVPTITTAMGNCYLYWTASGTVEMVRDIILDSHIGEPDAINAIEKVLVSRQHSLPSLIRLWDSLRDRGYVVRGDDAMRQEAPDLDAMDASEWKQSYLRKIVAFKPVENLDEAIAFINQQSSHHATVIATDSYSASEQFLRTIDSASIYVNASPRFCRCNTDGQIALGMSNQKGLHRGAITFASLTTSQTIYRGG